MDEIKDFNKDLSPADMSKNDSPLLDMDGFETLEASIMNAAASGYGDDQLSGKGLLDDSFDNFQFGLTTDKESPAKNISPSIPDSNLLDYVNVPQNSSLIDIAADTGVEDNFRDPVSQPTQQRSGDDNQLLIEQQESGLLSYDSDQLISADERSSSPPKSYSKVQKESEPAETSLPKIKDPKIVAKPKADSDNYESGILAYEPAAQPMKREVAMEAEKVGNTAESNSECECPFSPGAWFNKDKLHPTVAQYVYWQDPKKSGIALAASLVLLLSFKFCSVISVAAYLILALLALTVSFRIYKNVLQAIQKSNDGHPFKEFLDMDIALSQDKIGQTVETMIHHLNCVSLKLRSLILVEDLFDTLKFGALAWVLTYVGAWFNGLTLIILGVVSAFTLPKVYETNKAQIDTYAELVRTKGKEIIEMVNAKMPMGKKKKDQ